MAKTIVDTRTKNGKLQIKVHKSARNGWAAKIVGEDEKYGLDRDFIDAVSENLSSSGKSGTAWYELEDGEIYEIESNRSAAPRRFFKVEDGEAVEMEEGEVKDEVTE